jgi:O-antigen ligase
VDASKDGLKLTPEEKRVLRRPVRPMVSGLAAGIAHAHRAEAYNARGAWVGALPFGLAAVAVLLWWAAEEGGYAPTAWYPGALVLLALFAGVVLSPARRLKARPWETPAIGLLAAFTAWSFLSITWAGVRGDAWDGANRTLLYLTVYAVFALLRWRPREAAALVAVWALGTAAIGATTLVSDGVSAFNGNRLAAPTGYENASAALFLAAFWPAVALAARPEVHWAARSVLLAAGGLLLQLALLAQSRASVVAAIIVLLLYLALSRNRVRALLVLMPVAAVTLASLAPLLELFAAATEAEVELAVDRERLTLLASTAALLAIGAIVGFIDRPGRIGRRVPLPAGRRGMVVAALAAGTLVALTASVAIVADGSGVEGARQEAMSSLGSSRLADGLETGRYDMWRVAAGEFADHPLLGVGADNFAVDFARERRTGEEPLYPHSLFVRSFSQTGLVGGALFLGFVAAALVAALRRRRGSDGLADAVASASVAAAVYWLAHGSIDWLWEVPALATPGLALLGLASGLASPESNRPRPRRRAPLAALAAAGVLFAAAAGSYILPGVAALEVERAAQAWPEAPALAFSRLERARRLNPLSERPDIIAGALAQRGDQPERARRAFSRALERHPNDWYAHLQLALLAAGDGRRRQALDHLERARSLNPRELAVGRAWDAVSSGAPDLELDELVASFPLRSPLGRRPVDCRPVLGLASRCTVQGRQE